MLNEAIHPVRDVTLLFSYFLYRLNGCVSSLFFNILDFPQGYLYLPKHLQALNPLSIEKVDYESEAEKRLYDHAYVAFLTE